MIAELDEQKRVFRPQFMLDTDTASFSLRGGYPNIDYRIARTPNTSLCISSITRGELQFGVLRKPGATKLSQAIAGLLQRIPTLAFDAFAADQYSKIALNLRQRGVLIGQNDTYIAAHALSIGATLVTHNVRHFERVEGLSIVDWTV